MFCAEKPAFHMFKTKVHRNAYLKKRRKAVGEVSRGIWIFAKALNA